MIEADVENYLCFMVSKTGGLERKAQWIGRRGCPDRYVWWPGGKAAWVELKRPGGKPDPHQAREIARLRNAGVPVFAIDTIEGVDTFIAEMGVA